MKKGFLEFYWETGYESSLPVLFTEGDREAKYRSLENSSNIDLGDHLKIFDEEGTVVFEGIMKGYGFCGADLKRPPTGITEEDWKQWVNKECRCEFTKNSTTQSERIELAHDR